jgi:hypothetical protein
VHRQQRSQQRSAAYYRTARGQAKKKRLNARRASQARPEPTPTAPVEQPISAGSPAQYPSSPNVELCLDGVVLNEESFLKSRMLPYVRMVVTLIEGIELSYQELVQLLQQAMRQHSIARRTRSEYVLRFLHEHPP